MKFSDVELNLKNRIKKTNTVTALEMRAEDSAICYFYLFQCDDANISEHIFEKK